MRMPIVAKEIMDNCSFLRLFASICMEPANNKKLSMPFISKVWKSIEVTRWIRVSDWGTNIFVPTSRSPDDSSDNAMMPMVGVHLRNLWLI